MGGTVNRSECARSSWTKQKGGGGSSTRGKMKPPLNSGAHNNKERNTLTDTDSGQEMNSPYEGW